MLRQKLIVTGLVLFNISFILALPAQKKGIFDVFYDDDDDLLLDDLPSSLNRNKDYEIIYDTRQKGDENYRLHVDGVHVIMNSEPQVSSDLLEAVEAMYGMGSGTNEEISFIIGGVGVSSTTSSSITTNKEIIESSTASATEEKLEISTKEEEKSDPSTNKPVISENANLKRNTDPIKRRYEI